MTKPIKLTASQLRILKILSNCSLEYPAIISTKTGVGNRFSVTVNHSGLKSLIKYGFAEKGFATARITQSGRSYLASLDAKSADIPLSQALSVPVESLIATSTPVVTDAMAIEIILDRLTNEQFIRLQEIAAINSEHETEAFVTVDTRNVDCKLKDMGLIDIYLNSRFGFHEAILTNKGLSCLDDSMTGDEPQNYPEIAAPVASDVATIATNSPNGHTLDELLKHKPGQSEVLQNRIGIINDRTLRMQSPNVDYQTYVMLLDHIDDLVAHIDALHRAIKGN